MRDRSQIKTRKGWQSSGWDPAYLKVGDYLEEELAEELTYRGNIEDVEENVLRSNGVTEFYGNEESRIETYETIARRDNRSPWIYMGARPKDKFGNLDPAHARKVYICSRYTADTPEEIKKNVEATQMVCSVILLSYGDLPVAPHLYFPQILNDTDPVARDIGMNYGLFLLDHCDDMVVLVKKDDKTLSIGMRIEVEHAVRQGMDPRYIYIDEEAGGIKEL